MALYERWKVLRICAHNGIGVIDEDHLCLVIADVSGKGVPAALYMMNSKVVLQSFAKTGLSVETLLEKVNDIICDNNPLEMFGIDRVLIALNEDTQAAPEQLLNNMQNAVDGFVKDAEQFDDLTMLCLEYHGA